MSKNRTITVRKAQSSDAVPMAALLNDIIELGGTTAYQRPLTATEFKETFLDGTDHICCFVAVDSNGKAAGFQALEHRSKLPNDWGDIATFARVNPKIAGIGKALCTQTLAHAKEASLAAINATSAPTTPAGSLSMTRWALRHIELIRQFR